jgi:hypothetical protein
MKASTPGSSTSVPSSAGTEATLEHNELPLLLVYDEAVLEERREDPELFPSRSDSGWREDEASFRQRSVPGCRFFF